MTSFQVNREVLFICLSAQIPSALLLALPLTGNSRRLVAIHKMGREIPKRVFTKEFPVKVHAGQRQATMGKKRVMGDTGLEPATSTMSTSEFMVANPANHWAKHDNAERLHQCLHQITKLIEQGKHDTLAEALADSLDPDALVRLADELNRMNLPR